MNINLKLICKYIIYTSLYLISAIAVSQTPTSDPKTPGMVLDGKVKDDLDSIDEAEVEEIMRRLDRLMPKIEQDKNRLLMQGAWNLKKYEIIEKNRKADGTYDFATISQEFDALDQEYLIKKAKFYGAAPEFLAKAKEVLGEIEVVEFISLKERQLDEKTKPLFAKAAELKSQEKLIEYVDALSEILKIAPYNYYAHQDRAEAFEKLERFEDALLDYNWILSNYNYAPYDIPLQNRALALFKLKRYEEALSDINIGLKNAQRELEFLKESQQKIWNDAGQSGIAPKPDAFYLSRIASLLTIRANIHKALGAEDSYVSDIKAALSTVESGKFPDNLALSLCSELATNLIFKDLNEKLNQLEKIVSAYHPTLVQQECELTSKDLCDQAVKAGLSSGVCKKQKPKVSSNLALSDVETAKRSVSNVKPEKVHEVVIDSEAWGVQIDEETSYQARTVPYFKDGRMVGLRIFAVIPGSKFETLSLKNGDVILALDQEFPEDHLSVIKFMRNLQKKKSGSIKLDRNFKPILLRYMIKSK